MHESPVNSAETGTISALPAERRRAILAELAREGRIVSRALARDLRVSEDTIRRDIRELDDAGLLQRTHGGALVRSPQLEPYAVRSERNVDVKVRLGRSGAALVADGMTVLLYGGTTVLEAARALPADLRARIVTNDPRIALETSQRERVETLLVGGHVLRSSQLTVGSFAVDFVRTLRADICLIGGCGIHDTFGVGINDLEEAALQRSFVEASNHVVALVTPDKLQTAAPFRVTSAAAVARLITCEAPDAAVLERYRRLGILVETV
jgi:DeoR/GlpR family transcriptional regulator of sugar metabolism